VCGRTTEKNISAERDRRSANRSDEAVSASAMMQSNGGQICPEGRLHTQTRGRVERATAGRTRHLPDSIAFRENRHGAEGMTAIAVDLEPTSGYGAIDRLRWRQRYSGLIGCRGRRRAHRRNVFLTLASHPYPIDP
jgi:hypothetical protein